MGTTYLHAVASLDGYIADESEEVGTLFEWHFNGDQPIVDEDRPEQGSPFRVSAASVDYVRGMWSRQKVAVMGRHLFDLTNGWDGHPRERPRRGRVAPTPTEGLAPGGVVPFRHLGGGGNGASTEVGW